MGSDEEPAMTAASMSRVYDYWIGGQGHFPADRRLGDELAARYPDAPIVARENRESISRAVRYVAEMGVRQFLDVGAGPAAAEPSVHGSARAVKGHGEDRVVYVDNDPGAIIGNMQALAGVPFVRAVDGDLTDPEAILASPDVNGLLDLAQPVGLVLGSVAHFVPPGVAHDVVERFTGALAPGSYVVMSVGVGSGEVVEDFNAAYTPGRIYRYEADEVRRLFDGLEVTSSGICEARAWGLGDEDSAREGTVLAGVGRKR